MENLFEFEYLFMRVFFCSFFKIFLVLVDFFSFKMVVVILRLNVFGRIFKDISVFWFCEDSFRKDDLNRVLSFVLLVYFGLFSNLSRLFLDSINLLRVVLYWV